MSPTRIKVELRVLALLVAFAATTAATAQQSPEPARADEKDNVIELSPFTVVTSGNTGYGGVMGASGRLAEKYIDTPQAISIVTSELMKDAQLTDSNNALKFVPGVRNSSSLLGAQTLRGIRTASTFSDGFLNGSGGFNVGGSYNFSTAFTDRVEVVKGPSAAAVGRGDPAGFVNYVSKRPIFKNQTELSFLAGEGNDEHNTYEVRLDHNGFLSTDHRTAYRFVTAYQEGADTMQYSNYRRSGVQLAATHRFANNKGNVQLVGTYTHAVNPGYGYTSRLSDPFVRDAVTRQLALSGIVIPAYPLTDPDTAFALDGSKVDMSSFRLTAVLEYKLSDHWNARLSGSSYTFTRDGGQNLVFPQTLVRAADGSFQIRAGLSQTLHRIRNQSVQGDLYGVYDLDSIGAKLTLLTGIDLNHNPSSLAGGGAATAGILVPYNAAWNPSLKIGPYTASAIETALEASGSDWSPYAQAKILLFKERLQLNAAARSIWQDSQTLNRGNGVVTPTKKHSPLQPMYSILVKPREWLSIFGTYSEFLDTESVRSKYFGPPFVPPALVNETLVTQPATKLCEIGAKASVLKDLLTLSLTYFKLDSTGRPLSVATLGTAPDGTPGTYSTFFLSDDTSEGWEFEAFGQINRHFSFLLGGNLGTKSSSISVVGPTIYHGRLPNYGDSIYGYATYRFGESRYNGLNLTAGWKTYLSGWSPTPGADPLGEKYPNDIHLIDLGIGYGFKDKYYVYLKANNVSHSSATTLGDQALNSGRRFFAGLDVRF